MEKMTELHIRIPAELNARMEKAIAKTNETKTSFIRRVLSNWLQEEE